MSKPTEGLSTRAPPAAADDAALLARFVRGNDADAFAALVARHAGQVVATARRLVRDDALGDDVAQAVFIVLVRRARDLRPGTVLPAWLHGVTYWTAKQALRKRRRRDVRERASREARPTDGRSTDPADVAERADLLVRLDVALARLAERDRAAVVLRHLECLPMSRVASALGLSETAAAKRVSRAVAKLGTLLSAATFAGLAPPPPPAGFVERATAAATPRADAVALADAAMRRGGPLKLAIALMILGGVAAAIVAMVPPPAPTPAHLAATSTSVPAATQPRRGVKWSVELPGAVIGTPVVADLAGDGKLTVFASCVMRPRQTTPLLHPRPSDVPQLFAFRADGTLVDGFPVVLGPRGNRTDTGGHWAATPSVARVDGRDVVLAVGNDRSITSIRQGQPPRRLPVSVGDIVPNLPVVDLDDDGVPELVTSNLIATIDGATVPNWPRERRLPLGYAPCVGDAWGDGNLALFHLLYTTPNTANANVVAVDAHGVPLPGWPHVIDDASWVAPVMGDLDGDGKMEVVASYGSHVFAWRADGSTLPNTTRDGPLDGILISNVSATTSSPALADLDGDGKAEIVIYDQRSRAIHAWHGDGAGVGDERRGTDPATRPARDAGVIAAVPDGHGVSVVSLGDDPHVFDFFTGTSWVRRWPDGTTKLMQMVADGSTATEWVQPTVCDVDGDGFADVLIGLSDGRLFVYETGLAYHAERMQWPTANGNLAHTGAWRAPASQR